MKTVHGWCFPDADDFMANEMKADGSYQAGHLREALAFVTDWSVAIDGGAHVGTWTRLLSARFTRVIAVEPSADTCEALRANVQEFGCKNVDIHHLALGPTTGLVSMGIDPRGAELKNTGARYVVDGGDVPMLPIDVWALPSLGFLKLDVEGSEARVLRGARKTLKRCRPIVLFEEKGFGRRFGESAGAAATFLKDSGYRELKRVKSDHIWGPK